VVHEFLRRAAKTRFVSVRSRNQCARIIWDQQARGASVEFHGADKPADPIVRALRTRRTGIRVIRCAERSDKHVRTKRNATAPVQDRHGVPGKVGKQLLASAVLLTHRTFERLRPVAVALAELGVAIGTLAEVRLNVLLPQ
jgi:hypothetical protein